MPVMKSRGRTFQLDAHAPGAVTVHPSCCPSRRRSPKGAAYGDFVDDLRFARTLLGNR
jgi:hypothetical protein